MKYMRNINIYLRLGAIYLRYSAIYMRYRSKLSAMLLKKQQSFRNEPKRQRNVRLKLQD
jgi:hypothetical protein